VAFLDKTLSCRDCGRQFVFSSGEQQFYQSRGLTNEPGRCPECRRARKSARGEGGGFGYSGGSDYGGGGGGYGGGGYGGGGGGYDRAERPRRAMYPAVCSACGKDTEVPFQPRGDKPVYCSDCFESVRGGRY
jgi:CxxC-x17-CxxC domain-containing protein